MSWTGPAVVGSIVYVAQQAGGSKAAAIVFVVIGVAYAIDVHRGIR